MKLFFQTGDAELQIKESDFNLNIHKASIKFRGCLALIQFNFYDYLSKKIWNIIKW